MKRSSIFKLIVTAIVLMFLGTGTYIYAGEDFNRERPIEYAGDVSDGGAKIGLAVPSYTYENGITSIEDLNANADLFGGEIIGIDAGAGITEATKNAIEAYGLNLTLVVSSEAGMLASLKKALDDGKDIVVTLWDPHWAVSAYGTMYLDDPEGSYGGAESIESWTRAGLLDEDPVISQLLSQYSFVGDEFNGLLDYVESSEGRIETVTQQWIKDNRDIVDERWFAGIDKESARGGEIQIGLVTWACAMSSSNVLAHLLTELGYDARLMYVDAGVMFTGLAYGVTDITTTVWSPGTHASYLDRYAEPDWLDDYIERKGI